LLQIQALAMSLIGYEYQSNDIIAVRKMTSLCLFGMKAFSLQ